MVKKSILKISKSEFELIKGLLYVSNSQNFYGFILLGALGLVRENSVKM